MKKEEGGGRSQGNQKELETEVGKGADAAMNAERTRSLLSEKVQ